MKNILFIGHFKDASGYANAARGYLRVLDKYIDDTQYNLKILALNFEKQDYSEGLDRELITKYDLNTEQLKAFMNEEYILILCALPNYYNIQHESLPIKNLLESKNCLKSINLLFWETDTVPKMWSDIYQKNVYNELIVCCKWNQEVFSSQTGLKTNLIYPYVYDYYDLDKTEKNEKFTIFSMSQWQFRKGFDILIRAYCQEFFDQDDVELQIKTYRSETSSGFDELEQNKIVVNEIKLLKESCISYGQLPSCKIKVQTGFCSKEQIKKYYEKADVFCSATRGEGFGLTIAQAALSGVPCITPDLGGHIDFLDKNTNYFIKSSYEPPFNMPFHVYSCKDMKYVEPSLSSTREKLREAYNDWKNNTLHLKGKKTKEYTKNFLDERATFDKLIDVLK